MQRRRRSQSVSEAPSPSHPGVPLFDQYQNIEQQARNSALLTRDQQPLPSSEPLSLAVPIAAQPLPLTAQSSEASSAHSSHSAASEEKSPSIQPRKVSRMSTSVSAPFDKFTNDADQDIENWIETFSNWCDLQDDWDDEHKCKALLVYLGNEDLKSYYRSLKIAATTTRPFNWMNLKADFITKYKITKKKQVLVNALVNLKQDFERGESVMDYSKKFIALSNKIPGTVFSERNKVNIYVANLDPRIKNKMNYLTEDEETTLTQAEVEAKRIEEQRNEIEEVNQRMRQPTSEITIHPLVNRITMVNQLDLPLI